MKLTITHLVATVSQEVTVEGTMDEVLTAMEYLIPEMGYVPQQGKGGYVSDNTFLVGEQPHEDRISLAKVESLDGVMPKPWWNGQALTEKTASEKIFGGLGRRTTGGNGEHLDNPHQCTKNI